MKILKKTIQSVGVKKSEMLSMLGREERGRILDRREREEK